ncbi:HAMP domain-containing sensor histidine kinase [Paenibacillus sp. FSL H8-0537]|uniref:sensor histidine kinase n=1 Tax=Paenibacillus sp. FSL H8-0537 TaxID=2921399 RepID=UPI003100AB9E
MKLRTKMWIFVILSYVISLVVFLILIKTIANVANDGYSLHILDNIAHFALESAQEQQVFSKHGIESALTPFSKEHPKIRFEWIASDGTAIYDSSGIMNHYQFKELFDRFLDMRYTLSTDGNQVSLAYASEQNGETYYLLMGLPADALKPGQMYFYVRSFSVYFIFALPILVAFLIPYILSSWYFHSINRRIRKLNMALNQVNIQTNVMELKDNSKDEIGHLTRHYNDMTRRIRTQVNQIEQLENNRKLLLSNLSHDLRTPLTMMLGYAELIRTGHYKDEKDLQTSAKIILQRSRYMAKLLDQILDVSRQETDKLEIHFSSYNLSELIRKIASDYLFVIDEQELLFEVALPEMEVFAWIDASLIERMLRNLLDNSIRYGKDGHFLHIELIEEEQTVCIVVKDKGAGIPPAEQERIFDRFYRVDRGRKGEGLGIGLSIVKGIVEAHQGNIQLTSIPYEETTFLIKLPKN